MTSPLASIVNAGSKVWLDSVDPDQIVINRARGITGATSNPIIIADLMKTGRFDRQLTQLLSDDGLSDEDVAWALTDHAVENAERVFRPVWEQSAGDDGYVSFELDPLLEDADSAAGLSDADRTRRYVELGCRWSAGHPNRMIKTPATAAGIAALEDLAARGVPLNVTLVFSMRQYLAARGAIYRGSRRLPTLDRFKSVYSIFISRVDVYTQQNVPQLSPAAQGQVGIVNVKNIWRANQEFWHQRPTPLKQEIVFASTGTKNPADPPWKYVEALTGDGIQTNPPATNDAVEASGRIFRRMIDQWPPNQVVEEIAAKVDVESMERTLMEEGLRKFAQPQKDLLAAIAGRRRDRAEKQ